MLLVYHAAVVLVARQLTIGDVSAAVTFGNMPFGIVPTHQ